MNDTCMPRLIALVTRLVIKVQAGGDSATERTDLDAMLDTMGHNADDVLTEATGIVDALNRGDACGWLEEYRGIHERRHGFMKGVR